MARLKSIAKKLALSLASMTAFVVALELVARAAEPGPFSLFDTFPYVESEADGHWRHVPGFRGRWDSTWYEIDDRGLSGEVPPPSDDPDEVRVLCVGDSCTFGKGVLEADCWPRQLEGLIGEKARVYNLGVNGGYGAVYANLVAEHVDDLRPDHVVVGYNLNDFPNTIREIDEKVFKQRGLRRLIPQSLRDRLGRLAIYRTARAWYYDRQRAKDMEASEALAATASSEDPALAEAWRGEREHLAEIEALADRHGASTIVFLFPYESQVLVDDFDRRPIERIRGLCEDLGLPFVDLAEEFRSAARAPGAPPSLFIKGDRYHPNRAGYAVVAERVRDVIAELEGRPGGAEGAPEDDR